MKYDYSNMIGMTQGHLTIKSHISGPDYMAECVCGNEIKVRKYEFIRGTSRQACYGSGCTVPAPLNTRKKEEPEPFELADCANKLITALGKFTADAINLQTETNKEIARLELEIIELKRQLKEKTEPTKNSMDIFKGHVKSFSDKSGFEFNRASDMILIMFKEASDVDIITLAKELDMKPCEYAYAHGYMDDLNDFCEKLLK